MIIDQKLFLIYFGGKTYHLAVRLNTIRLLTSDFICKFYKGLQIRLYNDFSLSFLFLSKVVSLI